MSSNADVSSTQIVEGFVNWLQALPDDERHQLFKEEFKKCDMYGDRELSVADFDLFMQNLLSHYCNSDSSVDLFQTSNDQPMVSHRRMQSSLFQPSKIKDTKSELRKRIESHTSLTAQGGNLPDPILWDFVCNTHNYLSDSELIPESEIKQLSPPPNSSNKLQFLQSQENLKLETSGGQVSFKNADGTITVTSPDPYDVDDEDDIEQTTKALPSLDALGVMSADPYDVDDVAEQEHIRLISADPYDVDDISERQLKAATSFRPSIQATLDQTSAEPTTTTADNKDDNADQNDDDDKNGDDNDNTEDTPKEQPALEDVVSDDPYDVDELAIIHTRAETSIIFDPSGPPPEDHPQSDDEQSSPKPEETSVEPVAAVEPETQPETLPETLPEKQQEVQQQQQPQRPTLLEQALSRNKPFSGSAGNSPSRPKNIVTQKPSLNAASRGSNTEIQALASQLQDRFQTTENTFAEIINQLIDFEEGVMREITQITDRTEATSQSTERILSIAAAIAGKQEQHYQEEVTRLGSEVTKSMFRRDSTDSDQLEQALPSRRGRGAARGKPRSDQKQGSANELPAGSTALRPPIKRHQRSLTLSSTTQSNFEFQDYTNVASDTDGPKKSHVQSQLDRRSTIPPSMKIITAAPAIEDFVQLNDEEIDIDASAVATPFTQMDNLSVQKLQQNIEALLARVASPNDSFIIKDTSADKLAELESEKQQQTAKLNALQKNVDSLEYQLESAKNNLQYKDAVISEQRAALQTQMQFRDNVKEWKKDLIFQMRTVVQNSVATQMANVEFPNPPPVVESKPQSSSIDPQQLKQISDRQNTILDKLQQIHSSQERQYSEYRTALMSGGGGMIGGGGMQSVTAPAVSAMHQNMEELTVLTTKLTQDMSAVSVLSVLREEFKLVKDDRDKLRQENDRYREQNAELLKETTRLEEDATHLRESKRNTVKNLVDDMNQMREKIRVLSTMLKKQS